ncbi:hypothetical protein [Pseudomonas aeruginosa]|uniref:hypothetical protein n=1 Tax=Pseudomonas aeruginosa TaxID=287 RepID=UPI00163B66CF|nr:hypothetical protein [Pseudomonas aeruginosa]
MNTGFSGFPGKSAAIDGSMLGGAMGGTAVHSFAMHRRGAFHSTFSLALSPTGRNPAAPSNAFPPTAEGIFSTGNANSFSTDKPTEAPVADRAFRKADFKVPERFPRIACRKPDGHIPQWLVQSFRTRATHRLIHSMRTVHNGGSEITRQRRDISVDFPD